MARKGQCVKPVGGLLAIALAVMLPALPAAGALPEVMPAEQVVGVEGKEGQSFELFRVRTDGDEYGLVTERSLDLSARWSPDGRHLAFVRSGRDALEPWIVRPDGTGARRLGPAGYTPSWAPDSRRVAFATATEREPAGRLTVVEVAGGPARELAGTEGAFDPRWHPTGHQLSFARAGRLFVGPATGGQPAALPVRGDAWSPAEWAPDGRRLVWVEADADAHEAAGTRRLVVARPDGTGRTVLVGDLEVIQQPQWSPDGRMIAFAALPAESHALALWRVDPRSGDRTALLVDADADDFAPRWLPDARRLVFTRYVDRFAIASDRDTWLVAVDGSEARPVTATGRSIPTDVSPGKALRVGGADRIQTAVALSTAERETAEAVVLARADDYPDALTGGPLAASRGAPLLLTARDRLHPATAREITRLGARTAYLLGGPAALSERLRDDLAEIGVTEVTRLGGADRFDTARLVAGAVAGPGGADDVYVAAGQDADLGRGWPDALAVSGLAAYQQRPLLLVRSRDVPEATAAALDALDPARASVIGGPRAVDESVADALRDRGLAVDRLAGEDRYATSARVAEAAVQAGMAAHRPWLVTGRVFPDALAAGPAAASDGGVLRLVDGRAGLDESTREALAADGCGVGRVLVVGGPAALTPPVAVDVERAVACR
jgi:putative cell wall-binding protein/Tol biopolymer transport system component